MLVTTVRQQRAIGRAAEAAGGYFKLAERLSQARSERTASRDRTADASHVGNEGDRRQG